jgi:hypothetical protein
VTGTKTVPANRNPVRIIVEIIHGLGIFAIVFRKISSAFSVGVKGSAHLDCKWAILNHSTTKVVLTKLDVMLCYVNMKYRHRHETEENLPVRM